MNVAYRPIDYDWPGEKTKNPKTSPFRAGWLQTLDLLEAELSHLRAQHVVFQIDVTEDEIRLDGMPRANARPL